ncbi:MAG: hypothetical protein ACYC4E_00120, partial [Carboxydocellales bacterium]
MEGALLVTHWEDLIWLDQVAEFTLNRLYFGNEFCEQRIPDLQAVKLALRAAQERELEFTLVTPYVTDLGLAALLPLFQYLSQRGEPEIVVNDWGVLKMLSSNFPRLRPVLGRLLNKMIRDPRVAGTFARDVDASKSVSSKGIPSAGAGVFRRFGVTNRVRCLLKSMGVVRIELDNLLQGIDLNFPQLNLAGSLYYPYGCVTTGRACLMGSLDLPAEEKFKPRPNCRRQCREYTATMST